MCDHLHLLPTVNQRPEVLTQYDAQQLRGNMTSVPQDVIETID